MWYRNYSLIFVRQLFQSFELSPGRQTFFEKDLWTIPGCVQGLFMVLLVVCSGITPGAWKNVMSGMKPYLHCR